MRSSTDHRHPRGPRTDAFRSPHRTKQRMSTTDAGIITVVVRYLDPLLARGVFDALRTDRRLRVVVSELMGSALEDEVRRQTPQLVLIGENVAYSQLARLRSAERPPEILVLAQDRAELVGPLLRDAGMSCLASGATAAELLRAVHLAVSGLPTFSRINEVGRAERSYPTGLAQLTEREVEVLRRLSEGYTNPAIAEDMQISVATVRTHVRRIFQKLDVHSRRDLLGMRVPQASVG
jgi:two-component system, NarL family, response regulator EvgA